MDANMALLKDLIASSQFDIMEAFTPPPDCDLSVADARFAWPNMVLSLNFPASVHLAPSKRIREVTRQIIRESAPGQGFLISLTEDFPEYLLKKTLTAIASEVNAVNLPIGG